MDKEQVERLKKELQKIGIKSEEDLRIAIRDLPALNINIMTMQITEGVNK